MQVKLYKQNFSGQEGTYFYYLYFQEFIILFKNLYSQPLRYKVKEAGILLLLRATEYLNLPIYFLGRFASRSDFTTSPTIS